MSFYYIPTNYRSISAAMAVAVDNDYFEVESRYGGNETVSVSIDSAHVNFHSTAANVRFELASHVSDLFINGNAFVTVVGTAGNNRLEGGHVVDALTGSDSVQGTRAADTISVDIDGDDYLKGNAGSDTFVFTGQFGTGGTLFGGNEVGDIDTVKANNLGAFDLYEVERLDTNDVVATIDQLTSFDTIEDLSAETTVIGIRLHGEGGQINFFGLIQGQDSIRVFDGGLAGSVSLTGTAYADLLGGSRFSDRLAGGGGSDTYVVNESRDQVVEGVNQGTDLVQSSVSFTLSANVENLTLTAGAGIDGTGNDLSNVLKGNAAGNVLNGGRNADTMTGMDGDDTYYVDVAGDTVAEEANQGTDGVVSIISYTLGSNLENLTLAGGDPINGTGNALDNTLAGNAGVNGLTGKGGDDTYIVQNTNDIVVEAAGQGTDLVESSASFALSANVEDLTLTGNGAVNGKGNSLDNTIIGNGKGNVLDGGGGEDVLKGLAGNDTYYLDNKRDSVVETVNDGIDLVVTAFDYTLGANIENLTLGGSAAIDGEGNALANTITGNSGKNVLNGGTGKDILRGGAGSDNFLFDTAPSNTNVDHIRDFSSADRIHLENKIFKTLKAGTLSAAAFKNLSKGEVDADDRVLYDQDRGLLYYDKDGSGSSHAVLVAILDNHAVLNHGGILVV